MARRTRTYVAFDSSDIRDYRLMTAWTAWTANDGIDFDFNDAHDLTTIRATSGEEAIKASLRQRMHNSKNLILLVGAHTKNSQPYVAWEIEIALKANLPIIVANLNGRRDLDSDRCPAILHNEIGIHVPYGINIIQYALDNWPASHAQYRSERKASSFKYNDSVYTQLGM